MPFPRKLLNDHEDVILDLRPHWWFLAGRVIAVVLTIALTIFLAAIEAPTAVLVAALVLMLVALVWLLLRFLVWTTTNFVVTTDRLIFRSGVLSKHGREIPLERVNDISFNASLFERMIGAGDLVIESAGERGQQMFTDIPQPDAGAERGLPPDRGVATARRRPDGGPSRAVGARAAGEARRAAPAGCDLAVRVRHQEGPTARPHVAMRARVVELVAVMAVMVVPAACGGESSVRVGDAVPSTSLRIEVRAAPDAPPRSATLACDGAPVATGFIDDARAACALVTDDQEARAVLVERRPDDRICTQLYGGPQLARVTGRIEGRPVDVTVNRADGCGVADWSQLQPLLGPPYARSASSHPWTIWSSWSTRLVMVGAQGGHAWFSVGRAGCEPHGAARRLPRVDGEIAFRSHDLVCGG